MGKTRPVEESVNRAERRLLTKQQLSDRWQCSERMVEELWARREIMAVKVGRLPRFPMEGIEAYEAAHTVMPARGPLASGK